MSALKTVNQASKQSGPVQKNPDNFTHNGLPKGKEKVAVVHLCPHLCRHLNPHLNTWAVTCITITAGTTDWITTQIPTPPVIYVIQDIPGAFRCGDIANIAPMFLFSITCTATCGGTGPRTAPSVSSAEAEESCWSLQLVSAVTS
ncbi:hypothetical protein J1605_022870 [Eschrichtius robustus]|uniref:Uncharacterized protein n=1 Tax=Eschrichtius robustus TaxID=9764 RepID=A0AB34H9E2_ESCRO|nr:hypothetical protein J1605_022870 [Eschrichtius robustus]